LLLKLHLDTIQRCLTLVHPLPLLPCTDKFFSEDPHISSVLRSFLGHLLDHSPSLVFLLFEGRYLPVEKPLLFANRRLPFLQLKNIRLPTFESDNLFLRRWLMKDALYRVHGGMCHITMVAAGSAAPNPRLRGLPIIVRPREIAKVASTCGQRISSTSFWP
jgi:hypothetical protein